MLFQVCLSVEIALADRANQLHDIHFIVQLICSFLISFKTKLALLETPQFHAATRAKAIEDTYEAELDIVVQEFSMVLDYVSHLLHRFLLIL